MTVVDGVKCGKNTAGIDRALATLLNSHSDSLELRLRELKESGSMFLGVLSAQVDPDSVLYGELK